MSSDGNQDNEMMRSDVPLVSRRNVLRGAGILAAASALPLLSGTNRAWADEVTGDNLIADGPADSENVLDGLPEDEAPVTASTDGDGGQAVTSLRFREDGTFVVLILADIHIHGKGNYLPDSVVDNINTLVDREKPDLVIFAGDTLDHAIPQQSDFKVCLEKMVHHIEELGIAWSFTFGNHDFGLSGFPKDEQFEVYSSFEHCIIEKGPEDVYGVGNCVLPVLSHSSDAVSYNVWLIDSGDYPPSGFRNEFMPVYSSNEAWPFSGYAFIDPSVVNWYYNTSCSIEREAGTKVPGIMVCHIPIQEYYYAWKNRERLSYSGKIGEVWGGRSEVVAAGEMNTGMYGALWKRGDVKLMAFGHDHSNDFAARFGGIWLCGVSTPSNLGYWTQDMAGGRVVTLHEDGSLSTRMAYLFKDGWAIVSVDAPDVADMGEAVSFAPLVEGADEGLLFNYVWRFGSDWELWDSTVKATGEMTSEKRASFTPTRVGTYHVWIDAEDSSGKKQTSVEKTIEVNGLPWSIVGIDAVLEVNLGQEVFFSPLIDGDDSNLKYNYVWRYGTGWDLWGSTVKDTGAKTEELSGSFTPTKPGLWQVWIDVEDEFGNILTSDTCDIQVSIGWELVGIDAVDKGVVGDKIDFSAIINGDDSNLKYNYAWRYDSGWSLWGSTVKEFGGKTRDCSGSFMPTKPGVWHVWIDVEDKFGNVVTSEEHDIVVELSWAIKDVDVVGEGVVGEEIAFSPLIDGDDSNLKYNYVWRYGTGWDLWGSTVKDTGKMTLEEFAAFTPTKPGLWQVWINVEDEFGNAAESDTIEIEVS